VVKNGAGEPPGVKILPGIARLQAMKKAISFGFLLRNSLKHRPAK
jgi:hypothetical protein